MHTKSQIKRLPLLLTPEQASKISGLEVNRIRQLMEGGQLEYLSVSNRKLAMIEALQDYYQHTRIAATWS